MGWRWARRRECPFGHPGAFPRGLGAQAGVPIRAKMPPRPCRTRPGVNSICGFCHGRGLSAPTGRASQSSHVRNGIKSLQHSACWGVFKWGKVQYKLCLAKRYQWSMANRRKYPRQPSATGGVLAPSQHTHMAFGSRRVPRASRRSMCQRLKGCSTAFLKCKACQTCTRTRPNGSAELAEAADRRLPTSDRVVPRSWDRSA